MAVAIKKAKLEEGVKSSITINGEQMVGNDLVNIGVGSQVSEEQPEEVVSKVGLDLAAPQFELGEYHFKDWEMIKNKIAELKDELEKKELWLAKHHCPYVPGMKLKTNKGLGLVGLVVQEIVAPKFFGAKNRWEVVCYAIAKSGEVTKRTVSFEEDQAEDLKVTLVSKKS